MQVTTGSGLSATVQGEELRIGWEEPDWLGPGRALGAAGEPWSDGTLCVGDTEWSVEADDDVLVLRITRTRAATGLSRGEFAEPAWGFAFEPRRRQAGGVPDGLVAFGFQYTEFALPTRAGPDLDDWFLLDFRPPVVEPLLLIAPDLRTMLLGPLDAFHDQVIAPPGAERSSLLLGWHGDLDEVPAGFTTRIGVLAAPNPVEALDRWAERLRTGHGTVKPGSRADVLGSRLSYWTDNGSAYWYRTEQARDLPTTLTEAVQALRDQGLGIGSVQLDSWFYPHEKLRSFDTGEAEVPPTGLALWEARPDVIPDGIPALREALGDPPLVAHIRHLSAASPYVETFECWTDGDRAHPVDADYYAVLADQARGWGVEVLEHDWLVECFLGVEGLRSAPGRARRWQEDLDAVARARGLTLQWCMPSPADLMQAVTLDRVTSVRTSGDHGYLVTPGFLWCWFCYVNAFAGPLGLWPFKDVFRTDGGTDTDVATMEALLAALSGGPVGLGDRIGATDPAIVAATCRADGWLVKPDAPIAAVARSFARHAVLDGGLMVATTHSDHPIGRYVYAVAFNPNRGDTHHADHVPSADLGVEGPATVWDWRAGQFVPPGDWVLDLGPEEWVYRVHCPTTPLGISVLGDPNVFASAGQGRVHDIRATPTGARFRVLGAGETVRVTGTSSDPVTATGSTATERVDLEVRRDPDDPTGTWALDVEIGDLGWLAVEVETVRAAL